MTFSPRGIAFDSSTVDSADGRDTGSSFQVGCKPTTRAGRVLPMAIEGVKNMQGDRSIPYSANAGQRDQVRTMMLVHSN